MTSGERVTCPCGSGAAEAACCGPLLADADRAATALALMRSRYTAYVRGAIDHLIATHDPATRGEVDRAAIAQWSRETTWLGLEIVDVVRGGAHDDEGVVEFIARGVTAGKPFAQRERSRFRRIDGVWNYTDGEVRAAPVERAVRASAPGRNDPCPCGSGKKYKRCHG